MKKLSFEDEFGAKMDAKLKEAWAIFATIPKTKITIRRQGQKDSVSIIGTKDLTPEYITFTQKYYPGCIVMLEEVVDYEKESRLLHER